MTLSTANFNNYCCSPILKRAGIIILTLCSALPLLSCRNELIDEIELIRQDVISPVIEMNIDGENTLVPGSELDCAQVSVGGTYDLTLNINNNGNSPLIIDLSGISLIMDSNTEEDTFTVLERPSKKIDVQGNSKLVISFSPVSGGAKSASLSIPTNDFNNPLCSFTITGEGWEVILKTNAASNIEETEATLGGDIESDGGKPITDRGICWSTNANPTINDSYSSAGSVGLGSYSKLITGLTAGTLYYVRAYANNGQTTGYGSQTSFSTKPAIPSAPTVAPVGYPSGSGMLDISWSSSNGSSTYYDVYYSTSTTPPLSANGPTNIVQTSCKLTGLTNYQNYYVWIKAKNSTASRDLSESGTSMVGVKVTGIVWDKTPRALVNGTSETISAYCLPSNATEPTISWSSSNSSIATVSGGVVSTIASSGTVTIESKDSLGNPWNSFTADANSGTVTSPGPAGGIIFYDAGNYANGWRYLEVGSLQVGENHAWYNGSYINIPTAYSHLAGAGKENTDAIIAAQGTGNYMAMDCRNYSENGYTDFYMPSAGEVNEILVKKYSEVLPASLWGVASSSQAAYNGCYAYTRYNTPPVWGTPKSSFSNSNYVTWPVRRF